MKESKAYTLLDFEFSGGRKKLQMILTYFNDVPKIDIREYYFDEADEDFKPTKKGVQLDPKRAEALRTALEENAAIIDKHLLSEDLQKWANQVKSIESSEDFFSNFEFFKTKSNGSKEEIIFNSNHAFGKKLSVLKEKAKGNDTAQELLLLVNCLLISYDHSLSQFDEETKTNVGDFVQDQNQTWSSLLRRLINSST
jgi:hypothetical protein